MHTCPNLLVLLVLLFACKGVCAQTESDIQKLWNDPAVISRVDTTIISANRKAKDLPPSGELKLKRCKATSIEINNLQKDDSLFINLASKNGKPLKAIVLSNKKDKIAARIFTGSTFDSSRIIKSEDQLCLQIKAPFSLKKRAVQLQLQVFSASSSDTTYTRFDTLYRQHPSAWVDTLYRTMKGDGTTFSLIDQDVRLYGNGDQAVQEKLELKHRREQGPRKKLLPSGTQRLRRFGKTKLSYDNFKTGDTVLIAIDALGKQPIAQYQALDDQGNQLAGAIEEMVIRDTVVIKAEKRIDLILKGKPALSRQLAKVEVSVIPPAVIRSYYEKTDSIFKTQEVTFYDTILLKIVDEVSSLAPLRNIESRPFRAIDIKMPLSISGKEKFLFMAFWIGTSYEVIQTYNENETTIPEDWVQPGIPLGLGAYGLGKKFNLPLITTTDIDFSIVNLRQKKALEKGNTRAGAIYRFRGSSPNFGILKLSDLKGSVGERDEVSGLSRRRFFLWFRNKNSINTYPLAIKMVGFYRYPTGTQRIRTFLTTRTSEIPKG